MAKIIRRLNPEATYIIVDTPLFSTLQWLYLGTCLDPTDIRFVDSGAKGIEEGKINIMPLTALEIPVSVECFVSTWALSESTRYAQERVVVGDWFGAPHLLLGYQRQVAQFPDAEWVGVAAEAAGATIEDCGFSQRDRYAFR